MNADLHATKRLIAALLRGERPDEAAVRTAKGEVDGFVVDRVEVQAPAEPALPAPALAVTTDEVIVAMVPLFNVFENLLVEIREKVGGKLVVSNEAAEAFINAHAVLKKAGHEPLKHRRVNPLKFIPIVQRV